MSKELKNENFQDFEVKSRLGQRWTRDDFIINLIVNEDTKNILYLFKKEILIKNINNFQMYFHDFYNANRK